jgi:hypothetical protein
MIAGVNGFCYTFGRSTSHVHPFLSMTNLSTALRFICLLLICATTLRAQVTTRSLPGDNASLNQFGALGLQVGTTRLTLAPPDVARLKSEDLTAKKPGNRYGSGCSRPPM